MRRWSPGVRLCAWLCLATPMLVSGCERGSTTKHPDDEDPDELGDGSLDGRGPGGIGSVTDAMTSADPRIVEAEGLLAEGKYERGLATIDAAIADDPNQARFHYVRGNALSYLDRDAEARAEQERAIELDPADALPHAAIGNLIAFQDDATLEHRRESIPYFQQALHLNPKLAPAHQALGVVLLSLGDVQGAIEALDTADRIAGSLETAYLLAQAYAEIGNDEKALSYTKSALEYEPGDNGVDVRLFYARLLAKAGQADEAAREYQTVASLVPNSPPLRLEVFRGLLELGKLDAALVEMTWLLEAAPGQPPILVNYGRLLLAQGKPKDAIVQYDAALAVDPKSQAAQTYKIEALVAAKRCKDARAQWDALASQLGYAEPKSSTKSHTSDGAAPPMPRALAKSQAFLDAGKCK